MSVSLSIDGPGDAELISAVRGGDADAYGELFARHVDAARRLARQLAGPADADDLVSDAFTKVLTVLQRGGGPDLAFRAYLLTAVRRLHVDRIRAGSRLRPVDDLAPFDPGLPFHDTAVEGFDNEAAARAFASLPERWQMVLWHTEVEQQKPADIAPLLGMSANSVSALAYRAREGLRQAFLSQHATDPDDVDCAWTRDHLGAYVRGGLSRRDSTRVDDHLAACRACAAVYLELTEVNSGLAALLAPMLLGTAGASYLTSTGAGASVLSTSVTAAKTWVASHASLTAVGGLVVTATAVLTIYGASHLGGGPDTTDVGAPAPLNRPVASVLPSDGTNGKTNGHQGPGNNPGPTDGRGVPPAPGASTAPTTTAPVSDESTAPVVEPTGPTSQPTGGSTNPTGNPTDPTSNPTDPTTGPGQPGRVAFDSIPPIRPAIGSTYTVSAKGGAGAITFTVDPTTTNQACSIAGRTVTFDHAGDCVIAAEDGGSARAAAAKADRVLQSIDVPQTDQTVSFDPGAPGSAAVDDTYDAVATSTSGRDVTFAVDPTTTNNACSISDSVVSFHHVGTCVVAATQAGDADLATATKTLEIAVGKGAQVIRLTPDAKATATVGDGFTVSGGASGNPVQVTATPEVCAYVDGTLSMLLPGKCEVTATQAGNDDYSDGSYATSMNVVPRDDDIDLGVIAEKSADIGGQSGVTATVTGTLPDGATATLTATADGNENFRPVGDSAGQCTRVDSGSKNNVWTCKVDANHLTFVFIVNTVQGRDVTFEVQPDAPYTDTAQGNNTTVPPVHWD